MRVTTFGGHVLGLLLIPVFGGVRAGCAWWMIPVLLFALEWLRASPRYIKYYLESEEIEYVRAVRAYLLSGIKPSPSSAAYKAPMSHKPCVVLSPNHSNERIEV